MKLQILISGLGCFLLLAPAARGEDLLIRAAKVYSLSGPALAPGAVLVSDGKIARVAAKIDPPAGAKVIDLGSGVLLPGLVDAYSHAGITGGLAETTRELTPDSRALAAVDWRARSFREALAEGTTTLGLAPGPDNVFAGIASVVKTAGERRVLVEDAGLVITMASDPASGNTARQRPDSIYVRQPTNRMGVVWMLRSTFDRAARTSAPELAVVREALAGRRRVYAVSRTDYDLLSLLRISREFGFTPTVIGGQEAYKVTSALKAAGSPVILGPLSTNPAGQGPESTELAWSQPQILKQAGIPFALSGGQLLDQARFAVRFGLAPEAALEAITSNPARLLGVEDRAGTIETGRAADLVALSEDWLEPASSVQWVLVGGKLHEKGN